MLEDFDFAILEDANFKEDAVREEIITPILKSVGYEATGNMKIVRSKSITHQYVHIGSQERKINIIPDYLLYFEGEPIFVLDAKSPSEELVNSPHTEQAFSYSIHPEIRCDHYGLCNGKQLVIYHVKEIDPVAVIDIEANKNNPTIFNEYLHPEYLEMPEKRDFWEDFGIRAKKAGFNENQDFIFVQYFLQDICKVEDDLYTATAAHGEPDGSELLVSFDFGQEIFKDLLDNLPDKISEGIQNTISRQPFRVQTNCKVIITCNSKLGSVTQGAYEKFVPLLITDLMEAHFDPENECTPK
ncbi:type I restriction enzyme HsdR N-terminal domain-containing protein [Aliifodinibius sp. S!AR15-10]|uniref:type I restriction enzyme HsdR N-terminal domain-containing protein n=1 Tax=Aliifodinibius sp. S!AR15-10 TaxID=2950437 RepID=UPI002861E544|nr:type I restriction enzyme HsdR N-terminal domain-containing protein [Aliifodinibius sp. S!AR15-10]MDR8394588.1 type I restriction enzyme HsdR N-terminal domain-containing protein [Aliifodinibius sp. S!AR15-10]